MSVSKSPVEVCNMALVLTGDGGHISGFNDGSIEGDVAEMEFDDAVQEILEEYPWTRARKFVTLNPEAEKPGHTYTSFYRLPSDFIQIQDLNGRKLRDSVSTAIDSTGALCLATMDSGPVEITYTSKIGVEKFTTGMLSALRLLLASRFALSIRKNSSLSNDLATRYEQALGKAIYRDGKESNGESMFATFATQTAHDRHFDED